MGNLLAGWLLRNIKKVDFRHPLQYVPHPALEPILRHMQSQNEKIQRLEQKLQARQDRFFAVTEAMAQGLLLLDADGVISSCNHSAALILDIDENHCAGHSVLEFHRSQPLLEILSKAAMGHRGEGRLQLHGRTYELLGSPVLLSGSQTVVQHILLFFLDVTEKVSMEQMRREFSANVSHELKTPLQTISGAAELLEQGLVKPEDELGFLRRISTEAHRMAALIEDILHLSRLEEGGLSMEWEQVDLRAVALNVQENLRPLCEKYRVHMEVLGDSSQIEGVFPILYDMVQNLCANSIRYNRPNGSVTVTVTKKEREVLLSVADTGIGIPPEHQGRVFERFYRVDKSHSRETGGTGLGLSIVKHGVLYHHGRITLKSVPEGINGTPSGTTVSVELPIHQNNKNGG